MIFDVERLLAALADVPPDAWSTPSRYADTGVHHGYSVAQLATNRHTTPVGHLFGFALDRFAPIYSATLTRLTPGGFIAPHRDAPPWRERWQVPILAAGQWGDGLAPTPGAAHRVRHWEPHSVWNPSDQPRAVLLVDVDQVLDLPTTPFEVYPIPDEYQPLVDRAREE